MFENSDYKISVLFCQRLREKIAAIDRTIPNEDYVQSKSIAMLKEAVNYRQWRK